MKLLLDQDLSFKLIDIVGTAFPNSKHVRDLGVTCARRMLKCGAMHRATKSRPVKWCNGTPYGTTFELR